MENNKIIQLDRQSKYNKIVLQHSLLLLHKYWLYALDLCDKTLINNLTSVSKICQRAHYLHDHLFKLYLNQSHISNNASPAVICCYMSNFSLHL